MEWVWWRGQSYVSSILESIQEDKGQMKFDMLTLAWLCVLLMLVEDMMKEYTMFTGWEVNRDMNGIPGLLVNYKNLLRNAVHNC